MATDQERAQREVSSLRRRVETLLKHPRNAAPLPEGRWRPHPDICLVQMPSFDSWASWSLTRATGAERVLLRRVTWDQMRDANELGDPIRRLKYVAQPLEPSIKAKTVLAPDAALREALVGLGSIRLAIPPLDDLFTIDGTRRQLVVRSGQWSLELSWTSLPLALAPLELWWETIQREMDDALPDS
jgi:hypothetical protein